MTDRRPAYVWLPARCRSCGDAPHVPAVGERVRWATRSMVGGFLTRLVGDRADDVLGQEEHHVEPLKLARAHGTVVAVEAVHCTWTCDDDAEDMVPMRGSVVVLPVDPTGAEQPVPPGRDLAGHLVELAGVRRR